MTKYAELSINMSGHGQHKYECAFPWPEENCFCQDGTTGLVISSDGNYHTAFFEAFPRDPRTFIRGEGETVQAAEKSAWDQYQKIVSCSGHEFERRGYTNGAGFCKHCGLFAMVFEPSTKCVICDKPTDFTYDADGNWYCADHQRGKPLEKWTFSDWHIAYFLDEMFDHSREGFERLS